MDLRPLSTNPIGSQLADQELLGLYGPFGPGTMEYLDAVQSGRVRQGPAQKKKSKRQLQDELLAEPSYNPFGVIGSYLGLGG